MGKTGGGKSMFCSYLINQCCLQKKRALVCITEGSEKKMIMRVIEGLSGVSSAVSKDCKNGNKVLEDSDRQKIEDAKIIFDKYVFMFKSSEATSVEKIHTDMKAEIERVKNHNAECKFNPTLHPELEYSVNIVDYTGRIAAGSEGDSGWEKIKQAFVERVQFCVNTETVGIDFAQVNSAGEEAALAGKCLTRAHIGLGRAIAQELTNFFTINTKNGSETGYLYVDKQRDGENEGKKFSMQKDFAHGKWDLTDSRELTTNEDSLEDVSKEDKK
jgi:hypothetical protein